MQPTKPIPSDIKTVQDHLFTLFKAVQPVEVQNILTKRYFFRYCVNEEIETPDPVSKRVVRREYEEKFFEPGETAVLMGGAAYIFLAGVAQEYVFEKHGAEATGDLAKIIEAAELAFVQPVSYEQPTARVNKPIAQTSAQHNPNVVKDNNGALPPQQNQETTGDTGDAFSTMNPDEVPQSDENLVEFTLDDNFYDVTANGRTRMNKNFVKKEIYDKAREEYLARSAQL